MPLKLGAYTACLHDRPLGDVLDVLAANGLSSVEVNTGGFLPAPHCPVDLLLSSEAARRDYLAGFAARGMELTGLCWAAAPPRWARIPIWSIVDKGRSRRTSDHSL